MPAKRLDIVLIHPNSRELNYQSLGGEFVAVENLVRDGLMAAFCRSRGLSVEVIDAEAENLSLSEVAERVEHLNPIVTAIVANGRQPSASTQIMAVVGRTCSAVKATTPNQRVLLLGGPVAALPEQTLREEEADFVAGGDGLYTLVGLVESLKSTAAKFRSVPGLWFRDDGRISRGPDAPLTSDDKHREAAESSELLQLSKR
jgi:hypothetical protein